MGYLDHKLPFSGRDNTSVNKSIPQNLKDNSQNKYRDIQESDYEKGRKLALEQKATNTATMEDMTRKMPKNPTQLSNGAVENADLDAMAALSLVGGAGKLGLKALVNSTEKGLLSKAYKVNPLAFKPNPENSYRMIGKDGYKDAIESGVIKSKKQIAYPEPYFGKGKIYDGEYSNPKSTAFNPQTGKRIPTNGYPGPYMVESKAPMKGVGAWENDPNPMITTPLEIPKTNNPDYTFYKQHWLQGYKRVTPEFGYGGILKIKK